MREENIEPDDTSALTREERSIYAQVSRRGFMGATAAATLAALVGREPRLVAGPQRKATADAVIVLWMAGGMAQTETFDPKRYTPFAPGVNIKDVLSTFPTIPTVVDNIKFTKGLEQVAQRHGPRDDHPDVQRGGSRVHPPLAASVSLAHRLHSAAADGDAAPRRDDLEDARPAESGCAGVHRHRADGRRARRDRHAQGLSHRGLPRFRSRTVPDRRSPGRRVRRPPAEGAQRGALPEPPGAVREAARAGARLSIRRRLSARVAREVGGRGGSPAALAVGEGVRPVARAEEDASTPTTRAASGRAACWPGGSSKRARATSRSRRNTSPSSTGTATRTATSAPTR